MKKQFYLLIFSFFLFTITFSSCDNIKINKETQDRILDSLNINHDELSKVEDDIKADPSQIENDIITKEENAKIENQTENDFEPDPVLGEKTFNNTCASCHGISGMGDGIAAVGLITKPRNLGDSEYVSSLSDEHLYKVINKGGASVGLSALMPPWGGILTDQDIKNVISHIRTNICKCNSENMEKIPPDN